MMQIFITLQVVSQHGGRLLVHDLPAEYKVRKQHSRAGFNLGFFFVCFFILITVQEQCTARCNFTGGS